MCKLKRYVYLRLMVNRELIYNLLRFALSDDQVDFTVFKEVEAQKWNWAFSVLSMHGVAPLVGDALERMPVEARPPKDVVLKFISAVMGGQRSYGKLTGLAGKIEDVMKVAGVKCLLLKGLSLAEYYPKPELRKFLDIDLYAPDEETAVDAAFAAKGVEVDTEFYRHSHMTLSGVLVENHHCLLDVRGRRRLAELDADLKAMALSRLSECDGPGLYYPDTRFSLIFNLHHAMSHFIYEGISFKFLVDWMLFLRREKDLLADERTASALREHGLLKFAAVMSEVSVNHLGLALEDVPECVREQMRGLKPSVVEKFIGDLFVRMSRFTKRILSSSVCTVSEELSRQRGSLKNS